MKYGLLSSTLFSNSDSVGWSDEINFKTPPASGSDELHFLAFGDMGKAPLDPSVEHFIQVCHPKTLATLGIFLERETNIMNLHNHGFTLFFLMCYSQDHYPSSEL